MQPHYPAIDPAAVSAIQTVLRLAAEDPNYLSKSSYPPETIRFLTSGQAVSDLADAVPLEDFATEAENLLSYVKGLKPIGNAKVEDGISYARAATSLLDKILTVKERAAKIKDNEAFMQAVMGFMQDVLTPEQRTVFMDRIANA